ncbi:MAG: sigma 54-interacting transcriptional regulator [Planctomycetes bacterium]|nr:sigma 54-interacting transcriptional regulator [Planctomycetota bacterium]
MLTLVVETGGRRQQFVYATDSVTIGRNDDNELRISSRFVSQHHCKLQKLAKGWKIVDLSSQNGTRVNGQEITQKMLKLGDRIEIGSIPIWVGEAPDEVTESLAPDADEVTPAPPEDIVVSARFEGGARGALTEELSRICHEFRKAFGDEKGLLELERAIEAVTMRLFPRRAFAMTTDAQKLIEVTKAINSELNLKRCLTLIMDSMISLTDAERGFLILFDDRGQMKVKVARHFDQAQVPQADFKFSHSIAEEVGQTGKAVISTSAQDDRRFQAFKSVESLKLRSILCVPFRVRDRVIGVLYLDHRFRKGAFTSAELDLIEAFADPAAIAIENARLYEDNKATQEELTQRKREVEELNSLLDRRLKEEHVELSQFRTHAPQKSQFKFDYSFIIGDSPRMMEIFQLLERVIPSDVPVLISGDSGTGKELIAKAIHENGPRKKGPFIKENCAAIPESLLESELFGYKKGAFTGADRDKTGLFAQAHRGTIFLDEIGETSVDMQKKLLRVIQEGEIRPVGSHEIIKVDVRLISASNKNLKEQIAKGEFREDLFYRLNVIGIVMPPLRERLEDIPLLVDHFLKRATSGAGGAPKSIDELAVKQLLCYHWPGNVRELENEIQRACAIGGEVITVDDFSKDIVESVMSQAANSGGREPMWKDIVKMTAHQKERELILRALEEAAWKKSAAALALGISRPTLDGKIKTYGLTPYIQRGKSQLRQGGPKNEE